MAQLLVKAPKLNRRSIVPPFLPYTKGIAGTVNQGYTFEGEEALPSEVPNPALGKWYKDSSGYYYWGGALELLPKSIVANTGSLTNILTVEQIQHGTKSTLQAAQKFLPYLTDTCSMYEINTKKRQLCFLAQIGHESAGLLYTEELASGAAYEGRKSLGNNTPGDGVRYKGRGLIQITGRGNYKWLSNDLNVDFITNPSLLGGKDANACSPEQLKYATQSAGWYWNNHTLNSIADQIDLHIAIDEEPNLTHFKLITKRINGGYRGLEDRLARYQSGLPFFRD
ncbi:MAG: hypothetical protein ABWY16_10385 [Pedobacter sp.]|uniref:glycoside hydrolase family 19 protein n=1 Tax=Pedobacter sp. TaxID=1411316 RepID=UPI00339B1CF2